MVIQVAKINWIGRAIYFLLGKKTYTELQKIKYQKTNRLPFKFLGRVALPTLGVVSTSSVPSCIIPKVSGLRQRVLTNPPSLGLCKLGLEGSVAKWCCAQTPQELAEVSAPSIS